jgi:Coproporphyrinogen III oxidase and related Fe-S oxidoreductases
MYKNTKIDFNLIKKYDKPGPRYTSYPTAVEFKPLSSEIYKKELEDILHDERPLSLYVHIPFCENACWFCGCNVIISHRTDVAKPYLNYLFKEVDMLKDVLKDYKKIDQFHIGGGTPNFLDNEDFYNMMSFIKDRFDFTEDPEVSIEIDPRHIDYKKLKLYKELGFNRISMGIQDFDRNVQERINRVQDEELLKNVIYDIRSLGYKSLNIDLMYGLPGQTVDTFKSTIEKTIELSPDRVAVFNLHMCLG